MLHLVDMVTDVELLFFTSLKITLYIYIYSKHTVYSDIDTTAHLKEYMLILWGN